MAEAPDETELERLGLYDPVAPDAQDRLRLLGRIFELGASADLAVRASRVFGLGSLSLDLSIRPPGESYGVDEFARTSGLDPALIRELWLALGLPVSGPVPIEVTPDAAGALRLFGALASMVGKESALGLARVIGSSAARTAESLASAIRIEVELPSRAAGTPYSQVVDEYSTFGRELLPQFLEAVNAVFRRHLVLVSYQLWSTDEDNVAVTLERTVGFADMVSSTEAVTGGSVAHLAQMVRQFEELVWDVVSGAGGRVVKLIGDEAMFVVEDASLACEVAFDLMERSPYPVRIGLARGDVLGLYGDYYGETVNLAARLVRLADPSTAVVSDSVRTAADGLSFEPEPARHLKGFAEPVRVHRLHPRR
jgi:class 3 adenylate cyclase